MFGLGAAADTGPGTPLEAALTLPHEFNEHDDQDWADLLSPERRRLLGGAAASAAGVSLLSAGAAQAQTAPAASTPGYFPTPQRVSGQSPWGYNTINETTPRPISVRPGEEEIPRAPRPYTAIESYHAHIYFDEDSYEKAVLIRRWVSERFSVELGNWNLEPRGPHVTPSFYFGFTNDLIPVLIPWLQLNSLGLTILLHPNTTDPRADHLHYALWVNRSQPVNAYNMRAPNVAAGEPAVEQIYPNTRPTIPIETV